jgi:hypothetical protein
MDSISYKLQIFAVSIVMLFVTSTGAAFIISTVLGIQFVWTYSWYVFGLIVAGSFMKGMLDGKENKI